MSIPLHKIPDETDWKTSRNPEWEYFKAREHFFGKSLDEVLPYFEELPCSAHECLLYVPAIPFQYYVMAYVKLIQSDLDPEKVEVADLADSFLNIILFKLEYERESIMPIIDLLLPIAELTVRCKENFGAELDDTAREQKLEKILSILKVQEV